MKRLSEEERHASGLAYGAGCRCDTCRKARAASQRLRVNSYREGRRILPADHRLHGVTTSLYTNSACRCAPCKEVWAKTISDLRVRRRQRLADDPTLAPHGRYTTYNNWGCRCAPCTAANTAYSRSRANRKKGAA